MFVWLNIAAVTDVLLSFTDWSSLANMVAKDHLVCVSVLDCRCIVQSVVHLSNKVQTHYDVLGLPPSASQTQIRNAYLQLAKQVF